MTKVMIIKLITMYALQYSIEAPIALAVAAVESNFDSQVIGITGDVGVFQLNPKSFPQYTIKQLKDPKLNIQLGIKYLAKVKKECKHTNDINWLICYNMGPKKAQSVRYPHLFPYVKKIKKTISENKNENL